MFAHQIGRLWHRAQFELATGAARRIGRRHPAGLVVVEAVVPGRENPLPRVGQGGARGRGRPRLVARAPRHYGKRVRAHDRVRHGALHGAGSRVPGAGRGQKEIQGTGRHLQPGPRLLLRLGAQAAERQGRFECRRAPRGHQLRRAARVQSDAQGHPSAHRKNVGLQPGRPREGGVGLKLPRGVHGQAVAHGPRRQGALNSYRKLQWYIPSTRPCEPPPGFRVALRTCDMRR
mmetsp:Transcript_1147/g.3078  ORF Transcript_1147/g.3078 Transcript_1147/m.3078 type:complete len:232 (+) Transcript_1147:990-1685(+)